MIIRKIVFIVASFGCIVWMFHFLILSEFDRVVEFLSLYSLLILQDWNK